MSTLVATARSEPPPASLAPSSAFYPSFPPHLGFLDGVRSFAACYVVLHHLSIHVPAAADASQLELGLRYALGFGHYAVDVFIVLSGYCLMLPVVHRRELRAATFFKRRALRILPPYYVSALASWLLIATVLGTPTGTHWDYSIPVTRTDLLTHALLIHDWFVGSANKLNHPHWSVAVEWKIYFLFPALWWLWRRCGGFRTVLLVTWASYGIWLIQHHFACLNPGPCGSSVYYVGLFSFGMLAAELGESDASLTRQAATRVNLAFCAATALLFGVSLSELAGLHPLPLQIRSVVVGAWAAALLVGLRIGSLPSALRRGFELRPMAWIGKRGFSLYLTHAPTLALVQRFVVARLRISGIQQLLVLLALGSLASLLVATGFYTAFEEPFHKLSRRVGARV